ncbi:MULTISPECIES: ABC transporter substrate-binding protein [unclassified Dietzia]|uniref:ABC transporter substrate-binding protein n=1 Tax=unclassified Dietzia TaxID=2617939 RepID=UPI0015FAF2B6|nr:MULTISPECIES: iron-siderophore ABC transporter substrate-binding protein [unclassified Dietzia]MBB1023085.1 iron-siderophore ABC transporter substrate-binding protein [Dietzia sp. DQ12-76]MBB1026729.1 iron-siderophore ABC transporter substrate-binding protein [Dietzia sp. DQ11-38-2]
MRTTLRRTVGALLATTLAVGLSACSPGDAPTAGGGNPGSDGDGSAFPVTVEHEFGETTIESEPQRVVTLGWGDVDNAIALGVNPVGYARSADYPGLQPWARDAAGEIDAVDLGSASEPDYERIASLEPDLIIDVQGGTDDEQYSRLSSIAPTVARPAGTNVWQVNRAPATRQIARALGRVEEGEQLLTELEEHIAQTTARYPQLEGKTGTAVLVSDPGTYYGFQNRDGRGEFIETIGMRLPESIAARDDGSSFSVQVASEEVAMLDGDVVLFLTDDQNFVPTEYNQLFGRFSAELLTLTSTERQAISVNTPLSVSYALDTLVPRIADAVRD